MAKDPSKRLPTAHVVALVLLPVVGMMMLIGVIVLGWAYYQRHHAKGATATAASPIPSFDVNGAVAALRGTAQAETKAAALAALERQASNGNAKAMVMAAACYRARLGTVHDDLLKAFEWYRKAAQAGEPVAMVEMSRYYVEGVWVEANPAESRRWLERAAQGGSLEAKWQLAKGGK